LVVFFFPRHQLVVLVIFCACHLHSYAVLEAFHHGAVMGCCYCQYPLPTFVAHSHRDDGD
jgi:hypothetical protein